MSNPPPRVASESSLAALEVGRPPRKVTAYTNGDVAVARIKKGSSFEDERRVKRQLLKRSVSLLPGSGTLIRCAGTSTCW